MKELKTIEEVDEVLNSPEFDEQIRERIKSIINNEISNVIEIGRKKHIKLLQFN